MIPYIARMFRTLFFVQAKIKFKLECALQKSLKLVCLGWRYKTIL